MTRSVVLIPVYNEEKHIEGVHSRLRKVFAGDVLLVDDGSVDCSPCVLRGMEGPHTRVIRQPKNQGYGATLLRGFEEVIRDGYDYVITMDSDGQHLPEWIPEFFKAIEHADIVSGSRYRKEIDGNGIAPADRRQINQTVTKLINEITGYDLSDAFCGFKAYRVEALKKLQLTDNGYSMPLQLWIQAAHFKLKVVELPVSRIYDDPNRKFGGELDDPSTRLKYYMETIEAEQRRWQQ